MPGAAVDRQAAVDAIVEAAILPSKEATLEQEVFDHIDQDAQVAQPFVLGSPSREMMKSRRDSALCMMMV